MSFVSSVLGLYACWVRQDVIARIKLGVIAMEWDWGRDILFAPCVLVSVIQVITAAQVSGHWGNWVGNRSCSRSMNSEQSEFSTSKVISSRLREKKTKKQKTESVSVSVQSLSLGHAVAQWSWVSAHTLVSLSSCLESCGLCSVITKVT